MHNRAEHEVGALLQRHPTSFHPRAGRHLHPLCSVCGERMQLARPEETSGAAWHLCSSHVMRAPRHARLGAQIERQRLTLERLCADLKDLKELPPQRTQPHSDTRVFRRYTALRGHLGHLGHLWEPPPLPY